VPTDPTVTADHDKFAWRDAVGGVWEPVGITVSYPTEEALASNSETPATYVYVVMKHSGYEWQSTPQAELPAGRDPNVRDKIIPQADLTKDGSLLVQVDVSQPDYPVDLFPTGPPGGGGLLGHNAGQPAFDPATEGSVFVGSMPSMSLPTTPQVDHGVLWVTGNNTGNLEVVDTAAGKYSQMLSVDTATSLGGVSVNPQTQRAYVAGKSLQSVTIFGPGSASQTAPVIWSASSTTFIVGSPGTFTVMSTGSPTRPTLSEAGALPSGVTFTDNGDGTATLAGTPATAGGYPLTITASNTVSPDATQNFTLTVSAGTAPAITTMAIT